MKKEIVSNCFTNEEEVLAYLKKDPYSYHNFSAMRDEWKKKFMDFCTGKKSLPILYEPFFKRVFHADVHPERLSSLISSIIGENVRVKKILPLESPFIEGGRMVVMDILVEAEDGSIANVEVQKNPYLFPGERMSCYSSDTVLRQYSKAKGEKGKEFLYQDLKKVYTIVIYEKTEGIFHKIPDRYIHRGRVQFDTGLELDLLQEYYLIALDVFRGIPYHKDKNRMTGWMSFLVTENLEDAEKLIEDYPWLEEVYREIASYREKPEEVLMMFSDVLLEIDRNTMQYMIDEQKKEIEENKKEIEGNLKKLEENRKQLAENQKELVESQKSLDEKRKELVKSQEELTKSQEELTKSQEELTKSQEELTKSQEELTKSQEELTKSQEELTKSQEELVAKDKLLEQQAQEIKQLRQLLDKQNKN